MLLIYYPTSIVQYKVLGLYAFHMQVVGYSWDGGKRKNIHRKLDWHNRFIESRRYRTLFESWGMGRV